ncbi:MAG: tetratricopeptide repeat protein, partial [Burkholderiales bacterium]|nr:tetratricopeptide repeat protein [Burkholderiales bacterium]
MVTAPASADPSVDAAAAEAAERGWLEQAESQRKSGTLAEAIRLGEQALASAERRGDARMQALAQVALANYHRYVPNSLTAIQLLNRAEIYLRAAGDPRLAKALTFKGMVLSDLGDHTRAIDLYREALDVMDRHRNGPDPDLVLEATCHGAIGIACTQLGEFGQAEEAYLRALGIFRAERNAEGMGYLFNNLAILRVRAIQALSDRGEAATALGHELFRFIDDGLDINERSVGSAHLRALLRNTRGDGLRALGRAAEALPDFEFARAAYRAMNSPRGVADLSADFGAALLELGRNEDALVQLGDGLAVAQAHEL